MKTLRGYKDIYFKEKNIKEYILFKIKNFFFFFLNWIEFPILDFKKNFNNLFENEIYKFKDYSNNNVCLIPEGTTPSIRIYTKNNKNPLFFYISSIFRYEKPQKLKLRQFTQVGIEIFNQNLFLEIKCLILINKILFLFKKYKLNLNLYFNFKFKFIYLKIIIYFFKKKMNYIIKKKIFLFKILENKKFNIKKFLFNYKFFNFKKKKKIKIILFYLKKTKIVFNPKLLRGINYYSNLMIEWCSDNKSSVCGGGNYSFYSKKKVNKINNSFGIAIGIERLYFKKKYKKKKLKIKFNFYNNFFIKNIKNVLFNENILIKKINFFYLKIFFKKKIFIINNKLILKLIKTINNEK